jgi:hypothetical protein
MATELSRVKKKLSPGQVSAMKRKAGKKAAKNPANNPVRPQDVKRTGVRISDILDEEFFIRHGL